jgi:hypothetical protein
VKKDILYIKQPKHRQVVINDLVACLTNPGRFSVLILGERGTGKSHWLKQIVNEYSDKDCLSGMVTVNGWVAKDAGKDFWESIFTEANNKLLVIDEVEVLSKMTQAILFEFLSTDNGLFGWIEKKYQCRIVFTSTFEIKSLRDTEEYLLHKFFDRISQFVVSFPSFSSSNYSVWEDFEATWLKMKYSNDNLPNKPFKDWLANNSHKFHGNFRDLDKLAINWRNYQLREFNEDNILKKIVQDFSSTYHFPEHKSESENAFYISTDQKFYQDIQPAFRKFVKDYARKIYGQLKLAPEGKPFGVPYRSMEGW